MSVLSDGDLRRRLAQQHYECPPITESTRGVLIKKLAQLEQAEQNNKRNNGRTKAGPSTRTSRTSSARLLEYSSAEEEPPSLPATPSHTAQPQRRISASQRNRQSNSHSVAKTNGNGGTRVSQRLLHYSDEEDDGTEEDIEGAEEEESEEEEEEVEEEDEDEDEEEEDDDDEEEDEIVFNNRVDFNGQTSPGLEDSIDGTRSHNNSNGRYRGGNQSGFRNRFASSTPLSPVQSTSSFVGGNRSSSSSTAATPPSSRSMATPNSHHQSYGRQKSYGLSSSHLRHSIASNKEFGSLGEALSTLPRAGNGYSPSASMLTQASPASKHESGGGRHNHSHLTAANNQSVKKSINLSVQNVSKLIMVLAVGFLAFIAFRYYSLTPSTDIRDRLPICAVAPSDQTEICVTPDGVEELLTVFESFLEKLQERGEEFLCYPETALTSAQVALHELMSRVQPQQAESADLLLRLLCEKKHWGMKLYDGEHVETNSKQDVRFLAATHPVLDWSCWFARSLGSAFGLVKTCLILSAYAVVLGLLTYGASRLWVWRKEVIVQEQQEVFELVEQVLSLLVTHQQMGRPGPSGRPPGLAVDHIRDELIPPMDRKRKQKVWAKVVRYISECESRVRQNTQMLGGDEIKVWHWLPDRLTWKPSPGSPPPLNPHGPNPYVMATTHAPSAPPSPMVTPSAPPLTPPSGPNAAGHHTTWQGSAFSSLSTSVASPPAPPTPCLKVRNLFDSHAKASGPGWVWQVKEEVLRRCAPTAKVLHIAVDTESSDGCVYIKCGSLEDAGRVFKTLHGQWYRGTLVTAKYLRLERYHERFPDAKYQTEPLSAKH